MKTVIAAKAGIQPKHARGLLVWVAAFAAMTAFAWPDRPIKLYIGYAAGGSTDVVARLITPKLGEKLGQPVVIENKPGAGAAIGADYVAKSKADGYTFLVGAAGVVTNSLIRKNMPYADSDLVPIGMIAVAPSVIVVNPTVPASTLREFAEWARKQGAAGVNWSTAGTASTPHFVAEMLKEAGVANINIIPYKSGSEGVTAVMSGNVSATSEASIVVLPQIKAGKLKALATTYETRITAAPSIPTTKEAGFPGVQIGHWAGLFAPKGTPSAVIERMNAELVATVKSAEFRDRLVPSGIEPAPYSLAGYVAFITAERARLARVAKQAGMQAD